MNSLKVKLIIIIITFIVVVGDVYAGCQSDLFNDGYFSNDGLTNCVNLFSNFVNKYSLKIHEFETLILVINDDKNDRVNNNFTSQLYAQYIITKINESKIDNADRWCKLNAAQIVGGIEDQTVNETAEKPQVEGTEDGTPNETIEKQCVDELTMRGYVYNLGIVNYAFFKKEPSLLIQYTDYLYKESKNITDSADEKKNISTDENISTNSQDLQTGEMLYSNRWCKQYAGDMKGYSKERIEKLKNAFENRLNDLQNALYNVCVGVLKADGFIHVNGANSYFFIKIKTHFITLYNKYLVDEATKLINKINGKDEWCRSNGYAVGCLEILAEAGFYKNNSGYENYNILDNVLNRRKEGIDLSNYEKNRDYYLNLIKAEFKNEIVQNYCDKLLYEQFIKEGELPTSTEFCTNYKEIKEE